MCPACIASTAMMVAGVMSTGGVTALAARLLRSKSASKKVWPKEPKRKEQ